MDVIAVVYANTWQATHETFSSSAPSYLVYMAERERQLCLMPWLVFTSRRTKAATHEKEISCSSKGSRLRQTACSLNVEPGVADGDLLLRNGQRHLVVGSIP